MTTLIFALSLAWFVQFRRFAIYLERRRDIHPAFSPPAAAYIVQGQVE